MEELELIGDELLVHRAIVDVEVIDAGVGAQLAFGRSPGRGDSGTRPGNAVGLADADQPGAMKLGGMANRSKRTAEQPTRRDAVAPARILADRDDAAPALLSTRCVDQRCFIGLADGWQMSPHDRGT